MKNKSLQLTAALALILAGCTGSHTSEKSHAENSDPEESWTILFDGSNLDAWRGFKIDSVPPGWLIEDNALTCLSSRELDSLGFRGADIMSMEEFENFELSLEWKISEGGNSGVLYFVQETDSSTYSYYTGPEMQILDNEMAGDNLEKHMAGDLYDLISCSKITVKPAGEWNSTRIVAHGSHVQHWLNDVMVVEYDLFSTEMDSLKKNSKWKDYPEFGLTTTGYIALQYHGNRVWYRDIKIRSL